MISLGLLNNIGIVAFNDFGHEVKPIKNIKINSFCRKLDSLL